MPKRSDDAPESLNRAIQIDPATTLHLSIVHPPSPVEFYSQANCQLIGLTPEHYLAELRRSGLAYTPSGKLRIVCAETFRAWLASKSRSRKPRCPDADTPPSAKKGPPLDDDLLAQAGLRTVAGGKAR